MASEWPLSGHRLKANTMIQKCVCAVANTRGSPSRRGHGVLPRKRCQDRFQKPAPLTRACLLAIKRNTSRTVCDSVRVYCCIGHAGMIFRCFACQVLVVAYSSPSKNFASHEKVRNRLAESVDGNNRAPLYQHLSDTSRSIFNIVGGVCLVLQKAFWTEILHHPCQLPTLNRG